MKTKTDVTIVSFSLVLKYCVIELYSLRFLMYKSLKTKSFSRKTEAFVLVEGGEMHSELLTPIKGFFSSLIKVCYPIRLFNHV